MGNLNLIQASFAGGEYSESLYSRVDLEKYKTGLRTCRNFIIHSQGGASNRCGTQYIQSAKYSSSLCVSQEFIFNQTQAYALEIGYHYIRFYTDGARIENSGVAYEVETPYEVADLSSLRFESSADVIFITHPNYQTRTLTRYGNANWVLAAYAPVDGPFMPDNLSESSSLTVSAVTGTNVTLTVSATTVVDPNYVVLLHMDGVNGSTIFTDEVGKTVTAFGNAQITTSDSVFGGACGLFDGTGDYLTIADSAGFSFGSGTFTIGFRVKPVVAQTNFIYSQNDNAGSVNKVEIYFDSGGDLNFVASTAGVSVANYTWDTNTVINTWYDIEIVRNGTNFYCFKNGVAQSATVSTAIASNTLPDVPVDVEIGRQYAGASYFNGKLDELRVLKGTAAHTAGFTVPTSAFSLTTSSTTGFTFSQEHIGALFKLRHYVEGQTVSIAFASATTSSSIKCFTTWRLITHGTWTGKIRVEKSTNGGTTWTVLRTFSSTNDFNADTSGTEDIETNTEPFLVRLNMYNYSSGTANVDLTTDPFYQVGILKVISYNSIISVQAEVLDEVGSTSATIDWAEGSFSTYRGFPSVCRFYQDRLVFANTDSEPQTIWMTQTSNYTSFRRNSTLLDTDGITVNLPSRQLNAINGLTAFKKLLAFTSASVWSVGPISGTALTPTSVQQDIEEYNGSDDINQMVIGTEALYTQQDSETIRNIGYTLQNDGFNGSDVNILAKHLFEGYSITKMAYQRKPNSIIWCLRSDGVLLSLTYLREQEVVAWAHHDTDGTVESICVIPGDNTDELWLVVNRDNGRFMEKMEGRKQFSLTDHVFMDTYTECVSTTSTVSNLTYLRNQIVTTLGDDDYLGTMTVSATGTLNFASDTYLVLLMHCHGDDNSTTLIDSSPLHATITANGDAKITDNQLVLGGTGYATLPDSTNWYFGTGNFSIDMRATFSSVSGTQIFIAQYVDLNNFWQVQLVGGKLKMIFVSAGVTQGSYVMTSAAGIVADTEYHLEFVRSGSSAYIFIDGVSQTLTTTTSFASNDVGNISSLLYIGQQGSSGGYFLGKLDEIRIRKGVATHTANFTPPTTDYTSESFQTLYVGLPYESDLETLSLDFPLRTGSLQGSKVKVGAVIFRLINTRGGYIGPNSSNLYEAFTYAALLSASGGVLGETDNYTGDIRVSTGAGYEDGGRVFYRQVEPLPVSIGAVIPEVSVGGATGG